MKTYRIYTLNHPITNEIRYVGQTCQKLENRLKQHLYCRDKSHKVNWVNSLLKDGLSPKIILLKDNLSKKECNMLEIFYIELYNNSGVRLVNMSKGGDGSFGFKHSAETKILLSKIRSDFNTPEHKEYLRLCGLKQWETATDNDKLNNILNQKNRKTINQFDLSGNFIKEYISLRQIERDLGCFRANISPCLKGVFKQAYGFSWKYAE